MGLGCVAQCVCSIQSTFGPTPCLECVHAEEGVDQMRGDWDTNMGSARGTHAYGNHVKGVGADLGSQVDMPACADACTHYNQGVGTDELWLEYADGAIQGWTGLNTTMLWGWVGLH